MRKAFEALEDVSRARLGSDLLELAQRFNQSGDRTLAAPSDYLEVVATTSRLGGPDRDHPEDWR